MIPAGKHDWYSPSKLMSERAASVFNKLADTRQLPNLPEVAVKLQEKINNADTSVQDLADTAKADPLFSVKLLKIADASRSPGTQPIKTLHEAIRFLGRKRLAELATPAAIGNFEFKTTKYSRDDFWIESLTTAVVAETLAKKYLPKEDADSAYLAAFFANIGKVAGAILLPEDTDRVFESTILLTNPLTWPKAEQVLATPDHLILGEIAAAVWGLPPDILNVIYRHHDVIALQERHKKQKYNVIEVVTFANQLTHLIRLESQRVQQDVLQSCRIAFRISDQEFENLLAHLISTSKISSGFSIL